MARLLRTAMSLLAASLAMALPALAVEPALDGQFIQGGMVVGQTTPDARVALDGEPVQVNADGLFVLGFGRDAAPTATLLVEGPDGERHQRTLEIEQREYDIQRIEGLAPRSVTPSEADLRRIRAEQQKINAARATYTAQPTFLDGFVWPVEGRITGIYGSQRILNGEPRLPHLGIDIAAPTGTAVGAAAPGTVTLAERDLFFTGGTVILDHGLGVSTVYSHLDTIEVAVGERLDRGQRLGTVGATGRATGPHLDWRINWFQVRLDPALLAPPMAR